MEAKSLILEFGCSWFCSFCKQGMVQSEHGLPGENLRILERIPTPFSTACRGLSRSSQEIRNSGGNNATMQQVFAEASIPAVHHAVHRPVLNQLAQTLQDLRETCIVWTEGPHLTFSKVRKIDCSTFSYEQIP